jgi:integrase
MPAVSGHVELVPSKRRGEAGRWYAKWRDADGQHKRKLGLAWTGRGQPPPGYVRKREAEDELAELLVLARRHARAVYEGRVMRAQRGATFEEVATAWYRRAGGERPWKPATERGYKSMLWGRNPHVMVEFGHRHLHEISRRDVRRWWNDLISPRRESKPLSPRDANAHLALFRVIWNWADSTDEYGPVADPSKGIAKCAEPATGKADFFEVEEVYALARAAEELHRACRDDPERCERAGASRHDAEIILVAAFTGMRRGEVVSLRWREVDFVSSSVHICESVSAGIDSTPKSRRSRTVTMAPQVAQVLARLAPLDAKHSPELVFPGSLPGRKLDPDALSKRFIAARDHAGLRALTFHDLRHTFASLLARAGESATLIQAEAGHASLRTTERYMHHRPRHEDAERFGRAFAARAEEQLSGDVAAA